jgi:hypothetical protein
MILPKSYGEVRASLYPTVGDQLEAIWKILEDIPEARNHPDLVRIKERIQSVKELLPKDIGAIYNV